MYFISGANYFRMFNYINFSNNLSYWNARITSIFLKWNDPSIFIYLCILYALRMKCNAIYWPLTQQEMIIIKENKYYSFQRRPMEVNCSTIGINSKRKKGTLDFFFRSSICSSRFVFFDLCFCSKIHSTSVRKKRYRVSKATPSNRIIPANVPYARPMREWPHV